MANKIALFGAGKIGKAALTVLKGNGEEVTCFIDNDPSKWKKNIMGIPVIGLEEFIGAANPSSVVLSCSVKYREAIVNQLQEVGVNNYTIFDEHRIWSGVNRESIVSYSHEDDMEDVVFYHVLRNVKKIFYIDVGSNDPWLNSVTKLLYNHGGNGINIDPLPEMIELSKLDRPRDINIWAGVGASLGRASLYCQGALGNGLSTVVESNRLALSDSEKIDIEIIPLKDICMKYISTEQEIHILKIDVEGFEKEVLLGADFSSYRPWIVCIESTLPGTDVPCYEEWESILLRNDYVFGTQFGVNRYYVAKEHEKLKDRFLTREELLVKYRIFHADLMTY